MAALCQLQSTMAITSYNNQASHFSPFKFPLPNHHRCNQFLQPIQLSPCSIKAPKSPSAPITKPSHRDHHHSRLTLSHFLFFFAFKQHNNQSNNNSTMEPSHKYLLNSKSSPLHQLQSHNSHHNQPPSHQAVHEL
ncbi:hypothetical protein M0R45_030765 [Rubus argutus]|uniref:Uncharacterized protein n=1 Tax=Rubus argutus TaxID=59490 RepID=A0AAW1WBM0_RUBAR